MKNRLALFLILMIAGVLPWSSAQSSGLPDAKKSQQELEIMKGILGTTLSFVAREMRSEEGAQNTPLDYVRFGWSPSSIRAVYLHGQGAVFLVPTSMLRYALGDARIGGEALLASLVETEMSAVRRQIDATRLALEAQKAQLHSTFAQQAPPTPPAPPSPPAPPAPPKPDQPQDEIRRRLHEAQEKIKFRREDADLKRQRFQDALTRIREVLVEALANHGDSLTHLKPNEYINLVLTTEGDHFLVEEGGLRARQEVLIAQRSWVTDYKAGRLTMDAFKKKVIQYYN